MSPAANAAFFTGLYDAFLDLLATHRNRPTLIESVTSHAYALFDTNIVCQASTLPALGCAKGCPACCSLRVTATAPEIFALAATIQQVHATPAGARLDLPARVRAAHAATAGLNEIERLRLRLRYPCPLLLRDICILHPVRPLCCRGLASFDKRGCEALALGEEGEIPLSEPHMLLRSLIQNALQAALLRAGYAWTGYEVIAGLHLVLSDPSSVAAWLCGADPLAPALATEVEWSALAETFAAVLPN